MPKSKLEKKLCPDCAVEPGEIHHWGCDVERCPFCGFQMLGCSGECRGGKYIIEEESDEEVQDMDLLSSRFCVYEALTTIGLSAIVTT